MQIPMIAKTEDAIEPKSQMERIWNRPLSKKNRASSCSSNKERFSSHSDSIPDSEKMLYSSPEPALSSNSSSS
uniref:Uncharacterized protein n=1 Tax=Romanomermis culicivorax TaxID=13658 RepID=A0A915L795_ROMCU